MADAESRIPKINDDDIEWVRDLMDLASFDDFRMKFLKRRSTVDLSACPGSGKTTLIVAKLAILAKKWPYRTNGICVLSHTNVAREQIEDRLGGTVVGQRLLLYPHFIDTIHGFANKFLALPWLYSNGYPSPTIDDGLATGFRRRVLSNYKFHFVQNLLKKKYTSFDKIRINSRDLSFDLDGKPFPASAESPSFQYAKYAVEKAAQEGYFCYDEMFVWAKALIEDHERIPDWLARRFPLVIIDEMQDTSNRQTSLLNAVFPRASDQIVVQRVGDSNQQIFDSPDASSETSDDFPDLGRYLEIPNSYRFGPKIALIASPFAVRPVGPEGLSGIGPPGFEVASQDCKHAIFVFEDTNTKGVLDAFGRHALAVLGNELVHKGSVTAVGHVHQDHPEITPGHRHYPKSVGHYWDKYLAELTRRDPLPHTLAQCVNLGQVLVDEGSRLAPGVEKIAWGTIELARRIGNIGDLRLKARTHRVIMEELRELPEAENAYRDFLRHFLIEKNVPSVDDWSFHAEKLRTVAETLCTGETDIGKSKGFLDWPNDDPKVGMTHSSSNPEPFSNVYNCSANCGSLGIQVGSIHSVKGQTHLATLLLSTFWHGHSGAKLLPWLLGDTANGTRTGTRDKQRLRHTYVAMTRPSHLLCLAIPRSALGDDQGVKENVARLRERGWVVAEIIEGSVCWRQ